MKTLRRITACLIVACSLLAVTAQADPPSLGYTKHSLDGKTATFLGMHPRWSPPYSYQLEGRTIDPPMDVSEWRRLYLNADYSIGATYSSDAWEYVINLDPVGRYNEFRLVQYSYEGVRLSDSGIETVAAPTETIEYFEPTVTEYEITYEYRVRGSVNIQMSDSADPGGVWTTVAITAQAPIQEAMGYATISCAVGAYDPHYTRLEVITDSGTYYTAASLIEVPLPTGPEPPTPNPAEWDHAPQAGGITIIMSARIGSTTNGPVEYYFDETSGNPAGFDSGWHATPTYTATGLNPGTEYSYRVRMRDASGTVGGDSITMSATTGGPFDPAPVDTQAPTLDPAEWDQIPSFVNDSTITMTAATGSDFSGPVEYYFDEITGYPGGDDSGWQASSSYTDSGLNPMHRYVYSVQIRDALGNVGGFSSALSADPTPPTPNPATFAVPPTAISTTEISMTSTTGSDPTGPVYYYFEETSGNPGATDSGWQTTTSYIDTGLLPGTTYTYVVRMSDRIGNMGNDSDPMSATTEADLPGDTEPPMPNPAGWDVKPRFVNDSTITMSAPIGTDASGPIEYYFEETSGNPGGDDSGWQTSPSHTDTGLDPSYIYVYRVRMRDAVGNVGQYSSALSADSTPPTPNPATFAAPPTATSYEAISMTATTGSDPSGPVYYYFAETSGNQFGTDSGWQTSPTYTDTGLWPGTTYSYTVRMRDQAGNEGIASSSISATTQPGADRYAPSPNPATFSSNPAATSSSSISMTSTLGSDVSGVEYYFEETSGNPGGSDSGWQASRTYADTGLQAGAQYSYRVRMRDSIGNVGGYSIAQSATTEPVAPSWAEVLYDDFEGGYGNWIDGGSDCILYSGGTHAHQGSKAVDLQDNTSTSFVSTGNLALSGKSEIKVEFWYKAVSMDNSREDFWLQISTNGGSSYTTVEEWNRDDEFVNGQFYSDTVIINGYTLNDQTRLRFRCDASGNRDDVYIDEVRVSAQ